VAFSELSGAPVTAANYRSMIASTLGVSAAAAAVVAAHYPLSAYSSPSVALGAVDTDAIGACSALNADRSLSKYVPTYTYEVSDEHAPELFLPPVSFPYGATHESEIQYLLSLCSACRPPLFRMCSHRGSNSWRPP
jgi:para-nitrobenzyl esterase